MGIERRTASKVHGDRACYIAGCKCVLCRQANASYQRSYRAGKRGSYRAGGGQRTVSARSDDIWPRPGPGSIWGKLADLDD